MDDYVKNGLVSVMFKQATGEPKFCFIINKFTKENTVFWNTLQLRFEKEFRNEGLEIDVGTKEDWERNSRKFGWTEIKLKK